MGAPQGGIGARTQQSHGARRAYGKQVTLTHVGRSGSKSSHLIRREPCALMDHDSAREWPLGFLLKTLKDESNEPLRMALVEMRRPVLIGGLPGELFTTKNESITLPVEGLGDTG